MELVRLIIIITAFAVITARDIKSAQTLLHEIIVFIVYICLINDSLNIPVQLPSGARGLNF